MVGIISVAVQRPIHVKIVDSIKNIRIRVDVASEEACSFSQIVVIKRKCKTRENISA